MWNHKIPQIFKATLRKKIKSGGVTLSSFKVYYKGIVIKTAWYWQKPGHMWTINL